MYLNILLSSLPLPTKSVGSWTNRLSEFQRRTNYFDHILCPTDNVSDTYIFCNKRKLNVFQKVRGNRASKVSIEYIKSLLELSGQGKAMRILVVDDKNLLEAVTCIKSKLPEGTEIIYSHHGHGLVLSPVVMFQVDKVLFLTNLGYEKSLASNYQFTPEVFIVGNGVVGDEFYPLSVAKKAQLKLERGWDSDDMILMWLANDRPVKGLHLFKKVVCELEKKYSNLRIISIGHAYQPDIKNKNWDQVGKIPNQKLPEYLQLGDVYFFTSLWHEGFGLSLAEAVKCGNIPITSKLGGIPEVLKDIPEAIFVDQPNLVSYWVRAFDLYVQRRDEDQNSLLDKDFTSWHSYEVWQSAFLSALDS